MDSAPEQPGVHSADSADSTGSEGAVRAEQVRIGDVTWFVDYDAALEVARRMDKPLWMHFGEHPG